MYVFPEDDLLIQLVDLYFTHVNLHQPLLHRPTFEKSIADKLHLTNKGFAVTLLVVCANGSRYSEDPRVFLDGMGSHHSRGWKWFDQVQMVRKSLLASPSIYDMQFYCVSWCIPLMNFDRNLLLAVGAVPPRLFCPSILLDPCRDRYQIGARGWSTQEKSTGSSSDRGGRAMEACILV